MGDLLELDLEQPVDAILSTATFHWIADHERLFGRLRGALRPGGRLVAQCGGEGNIDVLRGKAAAVLANEPYAKHFADWRPPWYYAGAEQTHERLLAAGFSAAECWLTPAPREPEQPARVPRDDRPRPSRATAARGAAGALHGRGARGARRAGRGRLCAAEHRRGGLTEPYGSDVVEAGSSTTVAPLSNAT